MLKIVNHIGTTSGSQEKHLKFPIDVDPRGPYKDHLVVRVDTGADVNCMNEKTFRRLFPKVKLSVCPYEIQNFGNSIADISILSQFRTYLQFRGEKYLNTFIVINANDCPNLLSHGATFRMGVLLPNYPEENVVKGENVPNLKFDTSAGTSTGASSNVFQILQDLQLKQYQETSLDSSKSRTSQTSTTDMTCTTAQPTPLTTYGSTPANQNTGMATPITSMSELLTSSRTTLPARTTPRTRQLTTVIPRDTSRNRLSQCCMHVHQPTSQVCKLGESLALRKIKHPHNGKTSVSRFPLTKQDISQYSGCFEGIRHFPGDPYRFHLKPDHRPARHALRKVPVHLEAAFKEEIESLVKQGILEEVKEHTDWVNSYVVVEKDTGNHHSPTHTVRKKLTIYMDVRDLNEALERAISHTLYRGNYNKISKQRQNGTYQTFLNIHGNVHGRPPRSYYRENPTTAFSRQNLQAKLFNTQPTKEEHCSQPYKIPTRHGKHDNFPRETVPARKREIHGYRYIYIRN